MHTYGGLIIRDDPRDWKLGDGNIPLKGVGNPDWTGNYHFRELQKINGFENDCCVIYGMQESFDAQVDRLIEQGLVDQKILDWFTLNGYMDSVNSDDGKPHFHTSERFIAGLTGNGFNGNAGQDPWNAARTFGMIPWTDWPFDATITPQTYFDTPPVTMFDKGSLFLSMIGGKDAVQFHWIYQGDNAPRAQMDAARMTAPLCLGVATNDGWNQLEPTPPPIGTAPNHMVDNTTAIPGFEIIEDHYIPYQKQFGPTYPIPRVLQGVVSIKLPIPSLPTHIPVTQNSVNILTTLLSLYQKLVALISPTERAKLGGASRSSEWPAFKKEFAKTHLPVCAVCDGTAGLNLHHLKPFHVYPELELDPNNVIWLCNAKQCHIRIGHLGNFQSINPTGKEDIVIWRDKVRSRPMTAEDIKKDFN